MGGTLEVCFGAGDEAFPFSRAGAQAALSAGCDAGVRVRGSMFT